MKKRFNAEQFRQKIILNSYYPILPNNYIKFFDIETYNKIIVHTKDSINEK